MKLFIWVIPLILTTSFIHAMQPPPHFTNYYIKAKLLPRREYEKPTILQVITHSKKRAHEYLGSLVDYDHYENAQIQHEERYHCDLSDEEFERVIKKRK